jgi:hypothetical protein
MVTIEVNPLKRRRSKQRLQAYSGRFDKPLPEKRARGGLTHRIGQSGSDLANQARIFLADADFHADKTLTRPPRAVTGER